MIHIRWQALIAVLGIVFLGTLLGYLAFSFSTVEEPDYGGTYVEGIAGQPNAVNPLFSQYNTADRDLASLIFNGLTRVDETGAVKPDLARKWEMSPDGLVYTFTLRSDVQWSDGAPLSADDVLYTIQTIQSSDYAGPSYIADLWRTVAITAVNPSAVRMQLSEPFAPFLDFTTIGLVPAHSLKDIAAGELPQAAFNRHPIGTGPFVLDDLSADHATLSPNPLYTGPRTYLGNLVFKFYPDAESLLAAFGRGEIEGISQVSPDNIAQVRDNHALKLYNARLAAYSLVFLNLDKPQFAQKEVRQALSYAIDRQSLIDNIVNGLGKPGYGPIVSNSWAYDPELKKYDYNPDKARALLDAAGWKDTNGDGVRQKGNDQLAFTLMTNSEDDSRVKIAQQLAQEWNAIGAKVDVKTVPAASLIQDNLRPRDFDAVLFALGPLPADPDPYPLWNSSQTPTQSNAGQNYGGWKNPTVDVILEEARRSNDQSHRVELYRQFQAIFSDQVPALILYYPVYTYAVDARIHGIQLSPMLDPSDRFWSISQWYLKTKRVIVSESKSQP
ncbi:MAG: peptide ABC transporter substrate-binding protein [Anaerolineae bacterium]